MDSGNLFSAKCVIVGDGAVGKVSRKKRWELLFIQIDHLDLFVVLLCKGRIPKELRSNGNNNK